MSDKILDRAMKMSFELFRQQKSNSTRGKDVITLQFL